MRVNEKGVILESDNPLVTEQWLKYGKKNLDEPAGAVAEAESKPKAATRTGEKKAARK